eukprot:645127-Amphidinium_carterae.1
MTSGFLGRAEENKKLQLHTLISSELSCGFRHASSGSVVMSGVDACSATQSLYLRLRFTMLHVSTNVKNMFVKTPP